jgi:hypothetical protein
MSRWTALSDQDYDDQPWAGMPRCESRGCLEAQALGSVFCADCLAKHGVSVLQQLEARLREQKRSA